MRSVGLLAAAVLLVASGEVYGQGGPQITPVPATAVQLNDSIWSARLEAIRTVAVPGLLNRLGAQGGPLANFRNAGAALRGEAGGAGGGQPPAVLYQDAYVYQAIELASRTLMTHPDGPLAERLDGMIALIAAAQEKDGYLYTARTINPGNVPAAAGAERWVNEKVDSYELFDLGCLFDAAVVHARATGKKNLLEVAAKAADLLDATFGPGKKAIWPGHPAVEMGLIRLSRATGEARYWKLAKFMIDQRGPDAGADTQAARGGRGRGNAATARGPGTVYSQAQEKFIEQTQAVGHAPGAMELCLAAAALVPLSDDGGYGGAVEKIYGNLAGTKMHVTGGVAADNMGVLPRNYALSSVNTVSNAAASAVFVELNEQMFLNHPEAQYGDAMERTLYNALLAAMSTDGRNYFDGVPLESAGGARNGRAQRRADLTTAYSALFALNTLAEVPELMYAQGGDGIYVNLYAYNTANIKLANGRSVKVEEQTNYPWDGKVQFTITPDQKAKFSLTLRIPGWASGSTEPLALYQISDKSAGDVSLKVNGAPTRLQLKEGTVTLDREWAAGDKVEMMLPMKPLRVEAGGQLVDARNRVVIQQGPLVYCAEANDSASGRARNLVLPAGSAMKMETVSDGPLGTVRMLMGNGYGMKVDENDQRAQAPQTVNLIPYYAWGNRMLTGGVTPEMTTWIAAEGSVAVAAPTPSLIATAKLTASPHPPTAQNPNGPPTTGLDACRDGIEPRSSGDNSPLSHFDWWPATNGVSEWVQAEWAGPQTISSTSVYWWDDTGVGECRPPTSWHAFYKDGEEWKPVPTSDSYGLEKDKYNRIHFSAPIKTTALKLEMTMPQSGQGQRLSVGIQEWKIR